MKFLKFVQAGFETYTGPIGAYEFVDGVSTVPIVRHDRDRLSVAFQFVEFEHEGGEEIIAGVAQRLVSQAGVLAEENPETMRQTDEEKDLEQLQIIRESDGVRHVYTAAELEQIADKKGISGLREIAAPWNVKHRSIPNLIELICDAQNLYLQDREADMIRRGLTREAFLLSLQPAAQIAQAPDLNDDDVENIAIEDLEDDEDYDQPTPVETASPEITEEEALKIAAATGDVAAAVSGE